MKIAEKIYDVMSEKHYKQSSIAKACGYDVRKFNDMLKGRRTIKPDDIIPICLALKITPNELFSYNNDQAG